MEDYPRSQMEFEEQFGSEEACRQYLFSLRWLGGTHQGAVRASHIDYYLDEFTFRFNRRTSRSRGKLFYRLVQRAVAVGPLKGDDIRAGRIYP